MQSKMPAAKFGSQNLSQEGLKMAKKWLFCHILAIN